ncbi:hypothetical protein VT84_27250 [Gemmata sp. SH-PL17]|uniref:hypothetical protein n=1 Tax=Gemmata sp. SH-PL17 TaxID=1630693 RepID=UPI00078C399F|nr:hypothetical protein [Gemmata sp. SH-PL17]AMV28133.1 hypothetical protein VT84_27250 [Gemmata sp. SH-PL17]
MKIVGIDGMTVGELAEEVNNGGKFVIFQYAISLLVVSFKNPTDIHFIRAGQGTFGKSIGPTLTSLVLGWWGIPFGIFFTIESLFINLSGGRDVTNDVMNSILSDMHTQSAPPRQPWER